MKETEKEIMTAIEQGVNYFDTAYIYPGSEQTLGKILERNKIRENQSSVFFSVDILDDYTEFDLPVLAFHRKVEAELAFA